MLVNGCRRRSYNFQKKKNMTKSIFGKWIFHHYFYWFTIIMKLNDDFFVNLHDFNIKKNSQKVNIWKYDVKEHRRESFIISVNARATVSVSFMQLKMRLVPSRFAFWFSTKNWFHQEKWCIHCDFNLFNCGVH